MNGIYFLGTIKEAEKRELEKSNERRNSLIELKNIIDKSSNDDLFQNINRDIEEVQKEMVQWWEIITKLYKWSYDKNDQFLVDFSENNVFLKKAENSI